MRTSAQQSKNWLEWAVFVIGGVLVLGVVGSLAYEIWQGQPRQPPRLSVVLGEPERRGDLYAVPVEVTNAGDETAEDVHVEVLLVQASGEEERSQFRLQFVPHHATRWGQALFHANPAHARLTARPLGYQLP